MLNVLFNPKKAMRHPIEMMWIAIFYSSISILLGLWIFPEFGSLIAVFFTVISCLYITQGTIRREEKKEGDSPSEKNILKEHIKPLKLFLFLFIGIVISFSVWIYVLPQEQISIMFSLQEQVLNEIQGETITGNAVKQNALEIIFLNNLKVLTISLIISLFYGAGAIFVIVWNASMMGFVIGIIVKQKGLLIFPVAFTRYFLHGIPEILSYLTVILAGGIIYMAFLKGNLTKEVKSKKTIIDVLTLIGISIIMMAIAALIEVFISPKI